MDLICRKRRYSGGFQKAAQNNKLSEEKGNRYGIIHADLDE